MQTLSQALEAGNIALDVEAPDFAACLECLIEHLTAHRELTAELGAELDKALLEREALSATAIGRGVVIPHAYMRGVPRPMVLFARLREPLDYQAPDGEPVDLVFLLTGPEEAQMQHLPMLARIVRLLHDDELLRDLRAADSAEAVLQAVRDVERRHA